MYKKTRARYRSIDKNQSLITDYFKVINDIEELLKKNKKLESCIENLLADGKVSKINEETELHPHTTYDILNALVTTASKNSNKKLSGYRYSDAIKKFSAYIFMLGGRWCYETLQKNIALPSPTSVSRYLHEHGPHIVEGQLRCQELNEYLQERNLPLYVWLSEDATRITGRVQYDSAYNQLVGFNLPLNDDGMPVSFSYMARSAKEIEQHYKQNKGTSQLIYVIMAQPLQDRAPPFCLCLYGTDNKFSCQNVLARWNIIKKSLLECGISIVGISSDGDSRLLKAMKYESRLGIDVDSCSEASIKLNCLKNEIVYIQDTIHIGTKLRNRLLKESIVLPFGNYQVSITHLRDMIDNVSKDNHSLTPYDVDPKDRQNFSSLKKITEMKVRDCLKENVPDSEATSMYLKICDCILTAFMGQDLSPLERVNAMWYALFIVRGWRWWIKKTSKYSLSDNFISLNAYTCVELNAQNLIIAILNLREQRLSHLFLPILFSSQPCESHFRKVRSFSSTYSTQVNTSLLEIINRTKKIQLQSDIVHSSLNRDFNVANKEKILFPRHEVVTNKKSFELPSNIEIIDEIEKVKQIALNDLITLGINVTLAGLQVCDIKVIPLEEPVDEFDAADEIMAEESATNRNGNRSCDTSSDTTDEGCNDVDGGVEEDLEEDIHVLSSITGELALRDYSYSNTSSDCIKIDENGPFAIVIDGGGKRKIVRKSSICWLLAKTNSRISSDRLLRVRESDVDTNIKKKEMGINLTDETETCWNAAEINVGEWCAFVSIKRQKIYLFGLVLGFKYLSGKTKKEKQYSRHFAPTKAPAHHQRGIGALGRYKRKLNTLH